MLTPEELVEYLATRPPGERVVSGKEAVAHIGASLGMALAARAVIPGTDEQNVAIGKLVYETSSLLESVGFKIEQTNMLINLLIGLVSGSSKYIATTHPPTRK
ncbi:MAG: hypothetical protein NT062_10070 [Proteobacteria bacterium]|nr:hypothetical protein [Pseudomonadota bacterium]